ncbi:MAG: Hsp33 family molecular chaperone HslO [Oscillospiraceae bacterium]|nr:Hsp33 family molecular chaperone HslO [Oscillospiraceae bacterium]
MMDRILRAISADGFVKIAAVSSRDMTEEARQIHRTLPVVTAAMGRTMAAVSIMSNAMKFEGASLTARINGGGPVGTILVTGDEKGNVRAYVQNPHVDLPLKPDGHLNVGGAVGTNGMLTVMRDMGSGEPYNGSVELVSGEIAEDFTKYFFVSDQVPSACGLGVLVDTDQSVKAAGGYVVQLMPGAPADIADKLERNIRRVGPVTGALTSGSLEDLIYGVLEGFEPEILEEDPVCYKCYCSREKINDAIAGIDRSELRTMLEEDKRIEVRCRYCGKVYTFTDKDFEL